MQICLITEGSALSVNKDVSSWIQHWNRSFSQDEFKLLTIGDSKENGNNFASIFPKNLIEVSEICLDNPEQSIVQSFRKTFLKNKEEREVLELHFSGKKSIWPILFNFARSMGRKKSAAFFFSGEFFEIVRKIYLSGYKEEPFLEFIANIRSMYFSQFMLMNAKIPKADLYHVMCAGYAGLLGSLATFLYDKPFVLSERGLYAMEREAELLYNDDMKAYVRKLWIQYYRNMTMCAYVHAQMVVSQNEKNRKRQLDMGCAAHRCMVVPEGIDIAGYDPKQVLDQKPCDKIIVGFMGSGLAQRDMITLLQGFSLAKTREHRLQLYIMGSSDADEAYLTYCKDYIVNKQILDVVFLDAFELTWDLHQADMMIFLSIDVNIPSLLLQAMACGIPVITTVTGGGAELVEAKNDSLGHAGLLISILDKQTLAEAILYLAQHRKEAHKMGQAGASRIRQHYTKASVTEEYKLIYAIAQGGVSSWTLLTY